MNPTLLKLAKKKAKKNKFIDFDLVKLTRCIQEAYQFVSGMESLYDVPNNGEKLQPKEEEVSSPPKKRKKEEPILNVKKRLHKLSDIEAKLQEIKGKKMKNIQEVRYKKNLKTRLKKHQKKEKKKSEKSKDKSKKKLKNQIVDQPKSECVPPGNPEEIAQDESTKVVFNKEDKMVFNRFDFSGIGSGKPKKKKKKDKDAKFLLDELMRNKSKLNELEQLGETSKVKVLKEKQLWTSALKKAEGIKIKDDPNLLKKTMRKQNELKKRHQRKWKNRVTDVENKKEERQKKRQENIAAKKKEMKKRKIKKSIKKGRVVI